MLVKMVAIQKHLLSIESPADEQLDGWNMYWFLINS
jgi:hypothetical protein